ncbi:hypothetical protein KUTeg_018681 [Tegillarca granosa]|uniref:THAP-type domain-containing protein n=1 Tax=Tegillarca granosa TaxID=220873 RepID=A0ABQ9EEM4_TEGGR|nr:hypothetical protein KUTeg_018681 [Tegillarca granosa]
MINDHFPLPVKIRKIKIDSKSKQRCCGPLCTSDAIYNPNLNFHHIPKNLDVRKQWIIKIKRDKGTHFKITPSTVVCSKHFKPEDCKSWTPVRKVLNKTAIPRIFDWSKKGNPRRVLKWKIVETVSGSLVGDIAIQPLESTSESSDSMTLDIQDNFGSEEQEKDRKIHELLKQLEMKTKECDELRSQLQLEKFGINRFSFDNSMIRFYSGIQTYKFFIEFFKYIEPTAQNMQGAYYQSSESINLAGRKRCML